MAEEMYRQIRSMNEKDGVHALIGYSMGFVSAVETLKLILEYKEISHPAHVFLAAYALCGRKNWKGSMKNFLTNG